MTLWPCGCEGQKGEARSCEATVGCGIPQTLTNSVLGRTGYKMLSCLFSSELDHTLSLSLGLRYPRLALYVAEDDLELVMHLPAKCWNYRYASPYLVYTVLGLCTH